MEGSFVIALKKSYTFISYSRNKVILCNLSYPSKCTLSRCLVIVSRFRGLATVWLDSEYLSYLTSQPIKICEDNEKKTHFS